tara:strand:+ start:172 stop:555 length:384 start_codon:yes stop_codon:yes gene_type:complete
MQRLLRTPSGKDLSEDPEAVKSLEQRLRRRANISARDLLLKGVDPYSKEGALLEKYYAENPNDVDSDPRKLLVELKDEQNRSEYTMKDFFEKPLYPEDIDDLRKKLRSADGPISRRRRSAAPPIIIK